VSDLILLDATKASFLNAAPRGAAWEQDDIRGESGEKSAVAS